MDRTLDLERFAVRIGPMLAAARASNLVCA
jgi:hypothetical protein